MYMPHLRAQQPVGNVPMQILSAFKADAGFACVQVPAPEQNKNVQALEAERRAGSKPEKVITALKAVGAEGELSDTAFGSVLFARKPGDGSAREQAASCQKVLGGFANICYEFATKRYRSNCINWGMLPFTLPEGADFPYAVGDLVFVPDIREAIATGKEEIPGKVIKQDGSVEEITLYVKNLTADEKTIILEGCLMNYYAARLKNQ